MNGVDARLRRMTKHVRTKMVVRPHTDSPLRSQHKLQMAQLSQSFQLAKAADHFVLRHFTRTEQTLHLSRVQVAEVNDKLAKFISLKYYIEAT